MGLDTSLHVATLKRNSIILSTLLFCLAWVCFHKIELDGTSSQLEETFLGAFTAYVINTPISKNADLIKYHTIADKNENSFSVEFSQHMNLQGEQIKNFTFNKCEIVIYNPQHFELERQKCSTDLDGSKSFVNLLDEITPKDSCIKLGSAPGAFSFYNGKQCNYTENGIVALSIKYIFPEIDNKYGLYVSAYLDRTITDVAQQEIKIRSASLPLKSGDSLLATFDNYDPNKMIHEFKKLTHDYSVDCNISSSLELCLMEKYKALQNELNKSTAVNIPFVNYSLNTTLALFILFIVTCHITLSNHSALILANNNVKSGISEPWYVLDLDEPIGKISLSLYNLMQKGLLLITFLLLFLLSPLFLFLASRLYLMSYSPLYPIWHGIASFIVIVVCLILGLYMNKYARKNVKLLIELRAKRLKVISNLSQAPHLL